MSLIINGFPAIHLEYSFEPAIEIPKSSLSSLPSNNEELLDYIINLFLKEKRIWRMSGYTRTSDYKRTLKTLNLREKSLEKKSGTGLFSLFAYYHSIFGKKISTEIIDDIDMPETVDAPANLDFNRAYLTYKSDNDDKLLKLLTEGFSAKRVFSVEHKSRNNKPTVSCQHCHGRGMIRCPECGGTGREQYEDGNYASGEVRLRTDSCHECGGTGKIPCPECNGSGHVEEYAEAYSIVKSVKETNSASIFMVYSDDSWGDAEELMSSELELGPTEWPIHDEIMILNCINDGGKVSFVKKNRRCYIEDNRETILEEINHAGIEALYNKNIAKGQEYLSELENTRGHVICRKEKHYVFPYVKLTATVRYGDDTFPFDIFIYESNGMLKAKMPLIMPTSFKEAIKMRIKSLFKTKRYEIHKY